MKEEIKIGVCGSLVYENKSNIKEIIYKLKKTFGDALIVIGGGRTDGADRHVKKYALEFDCKYQEYNPAHTKKNLYSKCRNSFYDKPYAPQNFFIRNSIMVKHVDYMIVFVEEGKGDTDIDQLIKETNKKGKKLIIMD